MTQEEKELLTKDLCARLPYGVKCLHPKTGQVVEIKNLNLYAGVVDMMPVFKIEECKPYLRPMSSMTEEEKAEYDSFNTPTAHRKVWVNRIDWLLSNHFDYRSLIEKGLALEAPEDMYN